MSHTSPNPRDFQPRSLPPDASLPDFSRLTELIETLRQAAQSLLAFMATERPQPEEQPESAGESAEQAADTATEQAAPHPAPDSEPSPARNPAPDSVPDSAPPDPAGPARQMPREPRCYAVPAFTLKREKELLAAHDAADLFHLLEKIRDDLHITAYLMEHFDESVDVDGFTVQLIGGRLQTPVDMLSTVCSVFADFRPAVRPETI